MTLRTLSAVTFVSMLLALPTAPRAQRRQVYSTFSEDRTALASLNGSLIVDKHYSVTKYAMPFEGVPESANPLSVVVGFASALNTIFPLPAIGDLLSQYSTINSLNTGTTRKYLFIAPYTGSYRFGLHLTGGGFYQIYNFCELSGKTWAGSDYREVLQDSIKLWGDIEPERVLMLPAGSYVITFSIQDNLPWEPVGTLTYIHQEWSTPRAWTASNVSLQGSHFAVAGPSEQATGYATLEADLPHDDRIIEGSLMYTVVRSIVEPRYNGLAPETTSDPEDEQGVWARWAASHGRYIYDWDSGPENHMTYLRLFRAFTPSTAEFSWESGYAPGTTYRWFKPYTRYPDTWVYSSYISYVTTALPGEIPILEY